MAGDKETPGDEKVAATDVVEELQSDSPEAGAKKTQPEGAGDSVELDVRLEQALAQVDEHKEQVLRVQAEMQNIRRRAEKDVEHAHKYSLEKIVSELLPVVDNLERALEAVPAEKQEDAAVKSLREGVELTLNLLMGALGKFKVEQVDPAGEPFDPQLHQAMTMIEQDTVEPNTIVDVVQKGYTLHDRLVRPAMVVVSKASTSLAPKIDEQA